MKVVFPNYNNCLTNVTNSILKYFGVLTYHETLKELDDYLNEKEYKNVVLILYDGMGSNLMNRNLDSKSFLIKNKIKDINAVFPPTTVASTTSVLSGLNPCEHGWLGWDMYYKEEDITASMFTNIKKGTEELAASYNLAKKYYPYTSILELLEPKVNVSYVSLYGGISYNDLCDMHNKIKGICLNSGRQFVYAYYEEPDHTMHNLGTDNEEVKNIFQDINNKTQELCENLHDTLVIVVADHGHMNSDMIALSDYPDIKNLLVRDIAIEGRACTFYVKEDKKQEFLKLFKKYFEEYFMLFSHEEVIDKKLFGDGREHIRFRESFGDYMAIAKSNKYFRWDENDKQFVSTHAGLTEDEVLVPLIVFNCK